MDVALLNRKVIVQKNSVTVDAIGNHLNGWVDFYSCYATIGGNPQKSTSAGTVVDNTKADFTVRWCKGCRRSHRMISVFSMRMRFTTSGIDHMNFKKKSLKAQMPESEAVNMGEKVQISDLADAIMETLEDYADLAAEDVKQAVREAGETVRDEIRTHAPKGHRRLRQSWAVKRGRKHPTA